LTFSYFTAFIFYDLFDAPVDKIPIDLEIAPYANTRFVLMHYGPTRLSKFSQNEPVCDALDKDGELTLEHSKAY
jgi:hypothetical protein